MEKLLFKRLEEVEEDVNDPQPALEAKLVRDEKRKKELEDELLDGDRPAREIQNVIDKHNMRMADARREMAEYSVKANQSEISSAQLRKEWKDYSVARLLRHLDRELHVDRLVLEVQTVTDRDLRDRGVQLVVCGLDGFLESDLCHGASSICTVRIFWK
ncbi:hypothetical protein [Streptomyces mirabilis]|uniref:hypothetical protein n=1 Tax=Streptomyces mirabilis TaxID=68239 RepID=UPI003697E95F